MSSVERGTGKVMGLSAPEATDALVEAARSLGEGNRFTRVMARELFVKMGHGEEVADGLVQALIRTPGVLPSDAEGREDLLGRNQFSGADWVMEPGTLRNLRHREWRLTTGRLDLASAETLVKLIRAGEADGAEIPEALEALRDRIVAATSNLK